jgi:Flavoprotein
MAHPGSGTTSGGGGPDRHAWAGTAPVLQVIGCATPAVHEVGVILDTACGRGWTTSLVLTPTAARWLAGSLEELADLTGSPVVSEPGLPGERSRLPRADAVLVAPASANSLNKCAAGISDTFALGRMNTAVGTGLPLAVVPDVGHDGSHPAFARSVDILRGAGVGVILSRRTDVALDWFAGLQHLEAALAGAGKECESPGPEEHADIPDDEGIDVNRNESPLISPVPMRTSSPGRHARVS